MITLTEYLNNPCGTLSIPYWKDKNITIPPDMIILRNNDFRAEILSDYIAISFSTAENILMKMHTKNDIRVIFTPEKLMFRYCNLKLHG